MKLISLFLLLFLVTSCKKDSEEFSPLLRNNPDPDNPSSTSEWLIPSNLVFDGGPGKDGIPALEDPEMQIIGGSALSYLADDDLVMVYKNGTEIKAYSQNVLDWHEIANDQIGEEYIAITYCPLTGTGIGWGRQISDTITTFGVSGLLYETNLMPYDRLTESYWSQMFNKSVNGTLSGTVPQFFNLVQMNYGALKQLIPDVLIISSNTGYSRDYTRYPYGTYKTNTATLFPISIVDSRLHPKEIVRGIVINDQAKAYQFSNTTERQLIRDSFQGRVVIIVIDNDSDFIVSFLVNSTQIFTVIDDGTSTIMEDDQGNKYDIFGYAIEGPDQGVKLEVPYSYMGYWFAWSDFYPNIEIYSN